MNNKRTSFLLFLTVFIDMMGFSVIFPIFPETLKFFWSKGNDPTLYFFQGLVEGILGSKENPYFVVIFGGLTGSIYAILQFIFAPLWGKISDRIGRKPILIFTSFGNLLGYCIWFFSQSFTLFVISRLVTGSMGGNISVASAAMADVTSEENRMRGMGMIGAGIGLGFIFGPPLGGILAGVDLTAGFPILAEWGVTVFSSSALLSVCIALLNFLLIILVFQESLPPEKRKKETEISHPVFGIRSSSVKELPLFSLVYFLFTLGFAGFEFCLNFFLNDTIHLTPREIGFSFVYMGGIVIFIQGGVIRRISGKIPEKKIAFFGIGSLMIGFVALSFSMDLMSTLVCLGFLSVGSALLNPSLSSMVSLFSHKTEQGKNIGILRGFGSLARAFSPILFSLFYFQAGPHKTFLISAMISLIVLGLISKIPNKRQINDL